MPVKFVLAVLVAALFVVRPGLGHAAEVIELGKITASGPYRIWSAINKGLLNYAYIKGGTELKGKVSALSAKPYEGKTPGNVLWQSSIFRGLLNKSQAKHKLGFIKIYKDPLGRAVTPGVVFINGGEILDGLVRLIILEANDKVPHIGEIYNVKKPDGKTPSHVLGLVDLATRRMEMIRG